MGKIRVGEDDDVRTALLRRERHPPHRALVEGAPALAGDMGSVRDDDDAERAARERLDRDAPERLARRADDEEARRIDARDDGLRRVESRTALDLDPRGVDARPFCLHRADGRERDRRTASVRVRRRDLGDTAGEPLVGQGARELVPPELQRAGRHAAALAPQVNPEGMALFER